MSIITGLGTQQSFVVFAPGNERKPAPAGATSAEHNALTAIFSMATRPDDPNLTPEQQNTHPFEFGTMYWNPGQNNNVRRWPFFPLSGQGSNTSGLALTYDFDPTRSNPLIISGATGVTADFTDRVMDLWIDVDSFVVVPGPGGEKWVGKSQQFTAPNFSFDFADYTPTVLTFESIADGRTRALARVQQISNEWNAAVTAMHATLQNFTLLSSTYAQVVHTGDIRSVNASDFTLISNEVVGDPFPYSLNDFMRFWGTDDYWDDSAKTTEVVAYFSALEDSLQSELLLQLFDNLNLTPSWPTFGLSGSMLSAVEYAVSKIQSDELTSFWPSSGLSDTEVAFNASAYEGASKEQRLAATLVSYFAFQRNALSNYAALSAVNAAVVETGFSGLVAGVRDALVDVGVDSSALTSYLDALVVSDFEGVEFDDTDVQFLKDLVLTAPADTMVVRPTVIFALTRNHGNLHGFKLPIRVDHISDPKLVLAEITSAVQANRPVVLPVIPGWTPWMMRLCKKALMNVVVHNANPAERTATFAYELPDSLLSLGVTASNVPEFGSAGQNFSDLLSSKSLANYPRSTALVPVAGDDGRIATVSLDYSEQQLGTVAGIDFNYHVMTTFAFNTWVSENNYVTVV